MRRAIVLLLLLFVGLLCREGDAATRWTRLRSANFTFVGDASERQIRRVAQQLEQFREVMLRALPPAASRSPVPTVVLVFADDRSFEPFKPTYEGRTIQLGGFFQGDEDVNYIAVSAGRSEFAVRVVFHEYSHFLVSNSVGVIPVWVNEGLAEVYETFEERDGGRSALIGIAPRDHLQLLLSRSLIPLAELMAVDHASPLYNEGSRRGLFYAESWALMHYLTFGSETRRAQLLRYLTSVRGGLSSEQALREAFEAEPSVLEQELRNYLAGFTFPAIKGTFDANLRGVVAAPVESLGDDEAQGYLGDLLARIGRTNDARAHLKRVVAANAGAARALFALGLLELRASNVEEALPLLERAATLMPEDAAFGTAYGRGLVERLQNGASDDPGRDSMLDRARSVLSKSIELDTNAVHALATLGYLELARGEPSRGTDLLTRAVRLAPASESYRLMLADALTEQGDYEQATTYLGPLLARGSRQDVRDRARRALTRVAQLRQLAAARAAASASGEPAATTVPPGAVGPPTSTGGAPSSRFVPVLREVGADERRVLGVFRSIECRDGRFTLVVQTDARTMNFVARQMSDIDFISYRTDTPGSVACGPLATLMPVLATYRPSSGGSVGGIDGDAVAIELIPDGYVPQ